MRRPGKRDKAAECGERWKLRNAKLNGWPGSGKMMQ
jgi:hypothetical protein